MTSAQVQALIAALISAVVIVVGYGIACWAKKADERDWEAEQKMRRAS